MWLAIFLGGIVLLSLHAYYFSGRITRALVEVVPRAARWRRPLRGLLLWLGASIPILAVFYIAYLLIARPSSFGPPRSRIYDYAIAYPFWLMTLYSVQCTLLIAPLDGAHWLARRFGRGLGERWRRGRQVVALAIAGVFAVYVPIRIAIDDRSLEVRHHDYVSDRVPAALDGYRIALIADLQADPDTDEERLAQLVDAVNREKPDLIVIAGDLVTRDARDIPVAARQVGRLRARDGVIACIGDHDNFLYFRDHRRSVSEVRSALAAHGAEMLDDQVRTIPVGDARLSLLVATNNYITPIDPTTIDNLLRAGASGDVEVLLTHQTSGRLLAAARDAGVDLVLAGHTHGGQIQLWLPFVDLIPVRVETPYVAGAYRLGNTLLVVSNGLGVSVLPFRYRSTASVDIIRLRSPAPRP